MRPLTETCPKPLVSVLGMPILEHIVRALPPVVDELILVVGYRAEMIRAYCGSHLCGRRVQYVVQENPKGGTADALFGARHLLSGTFLVMYGDDIHGATALARAAALPRAALVARSDTPERFGVVSVHDDGTLAQIVEKPEHPESDLVNIGGFVLGTDVFDEAPSRPEQGEFLLTDVITRYAKRNPVQVIEQDLWLPIGYPDDIARAEAILTRMRED